VTAQILDRVIVTYRIGDINGAYPIFDATGSTLYSGRWNTSSSPVIYTGGYSTTVLEKLVHAAGGGMPPHQHYVEITIPNKVTYETFDPHAYPGWDGMPPSVSQSYGERWQQSLRSLLLFVPSVVSRLEENILINPYHPEFHQIKHSLHKPVHWDSRLFVPPP
jgi:RES domain-containing protein